jgi:transposase-like protein
MEEPMAMDFPIDDLMDEDACYARLLEVLHPRGLACPRCEARDDAARLKVHRRHRAPVLDYQCRECGRVFNVFAGTPLSGTPKRPSKIMLLLRGVAKGETTAALARELGCGRSHLLELRHKLQANAAKALDRVDPALLTQDAAVEADEVYVAAGEKRCPAHRPRRPAATAGKQAARARNLGQRPAAGPGRGRPRQR